MLEEVKVAKQWLLCLFRGNAQKQNTVVLLLCILNKWQVFSKDLHGLPLHRTWLQMDTGGRVGGETPTLYFYITSSVETPSG